MVAPDHTLTERSADVQGCPGARRSPLDMACALRAHGGMHDGMPHGMAAVSFSLRLLAVDPIVMRNR